MNNSQKSALEPPKKIFDPKSEASRKIIMNKKQKAEATRKRDEDIVMSKVPKIKNYKPQPLAEILNIAEEIPEVTSLVTVSFGFLFPSKYEEIVVVSLGVNTDPAIFKMLEPIINNEKIAHSKEEESKFGNDVSVHNNIKEDKGNFSRVTIVRDYEKSKIHGEDIVIAHLYKARVKPIVNNIIVQTDELENIIDVKQKDKQFTTSVQETTSEFMITRKRRESNMSLSSGCSPVRDVNIDKLENAMLITKPNEKVRSKKKHVQDYQVKPKERSRRDSRKSPCRYDSKSYKARSQSEKRSSTSSSAVSSSDRSSVKRRYSLRLDNSKKSDLRKHRKVNKLCTRSYRSDGRLAPAPPPPLPPAVAPDLSMLPTPPPSPPALGNGTYRRGSAGRGAVR